MADVFAIVIGSLIGGVIGIWLSNIFCDWIGL